LLDDEDELLVCPTRTCSIVVAIRDSDHARTSLVAQQRRKIPAATEDSQDDHVHAVDAVQHHVFACRKPTYSGPEIVTSPASVRVRFEQIEPLRD
jgi:hypothetical protein